MNATQTGRQDVEAADTGTHRPHPKRTPGDGGPAPKKDPRKKSGPDRHGPARKRARRRGDRPPAARTALAARTERMPGTARAPQAGSATSATPSAPAPNATRASARNATRSSASETAQPPAPTTPRNALGRYGEDLATRRLLEAGMRILDRNWRCRDGEIDIVAADGDALVVCEVKTRRAGWYEHPMAAVRPEKTARLRLLAERWMERHGGPPPGGVRIDVIGILLPARGAPVVEHVRGVA